MRDYYLKKIEVEGKIYRIVSWAGESVGLETLNGNDRILISVDQLPTVEV